MLLLFLFLNCASLAFRADSSLPHCIGPWILSSARGHRLQYESIHLDLLNDQVQVSLSFGYMAV